MSSSVPAIEDFKVLQSTHQDGTNASSKRNLLCFREPAEYSFLSPNSNLRVTWTMLLLCASAYNALLLPMRSTFPFEDRGALWYTLDYLCDVVYIVDLVWRFFVGYYALGVIVASRKLVARHYFRSHFVLDLLSSLPFDLVYFKDPQVHAFLRLNRILRLYHWPEILRSREDVSTRPYLLRLFKLFCGVVFLAHCNSCSFFAVIKQQNKVQHGSWPLGVNGWSNGYEAYLHAPIIESYPRCLYWSLCFTTGQGPSPNRPRTRVELYYSHVMLFLGVFVFATVVGSVGDLISNSNATAAKHRQRIDTVNLWLRLKGIKPSLRHRIRNYYNYMWQRQAGLKDSDILDDLPQHLRAVVTSDLNRDILSSVTLFERFQDVAFKHALARRLKTVVYTPSDYVVREGDFGNSMFLVARGILNVEVAGIGVVNTLSDGAYFGEISLIVQARRNASVVASTFADVFTLHADDLNEVLRDFPEFAPDIHEMGLAIRKHSAEAQGGDVFAPGHKRGDSSASSKSDESAEAPAMPAALVVGASPAAREILNLMREVESNVSACERLRGEEREAVRLMLFSIAALIPKAGETTEAPSDEPRMFGTARKRNEPHMVTSPEPRVLSPKVRRVPSVTSDVHGSGDSKKSTDSISTTSTSLSPTGPIHSVSSEDPRARVAVTSITPQSSGPIATSTGSRTSGGTVPMRTPSSGRRGPTPLRPQPASGPAPRALRSSSRVAPVEVELSDSGSDLVTAVVRRR